MFFSKAYTKMSLSEILNSFICVSFSEDFRDGVKLCILVARLQNRAKIKGMKSQPKNRHQKIENVTLALQATRQDKVKLVNIGKCVSVFKCLG